MDAIQHLSKIRGRADAETVADLLHRIIGGDQKLGCLLAESFPTKMVGRFSCEPFDILIQKRFADLTKPRILGDREVWIRLHSLQHFFKNDDLRIGGCRLQPVCKKLQDAKKRCDRTDVYRFIQRQRQECFPKPIVIIDLLQFISAWRIGRKIKKADGIKANAILCDPIGMIAASFGNIDHFVLCDLDFFIAANDAPPTMLHKSQIMHIHALAVIAVVGFVEAEFIESECAQEYYIIQG